jgi:hypothetical protein
MYQITAGDLYWRHTFVRSFSSTISGSIINRVPESSAQIGNTDYNAGLTLSYQPIEWATISGSYNYLETTYNNIPESYPSNTDPRTENRYSLTIEVKY